MTQASRRDQGELQRLARLYGVQTSYLDMDKRSIQARPEALLAALRSLGAAVQGPADAAGAALQKELELWSWQLDPVVLAWEGLPATATLRLPAGATGRVELELRLEDGDSTLSSLDLADLPVVEEAGLDGQRFVARRVDLRANELLAQARLPLGYHDLTLTIGERRLRSLVIAAPKRFFAPEREKRWGVFMPLYSLHSQRSWGVGDVSDLEALVDLAARESADFVATLPLLASFLDQPLEPSPYSPVSRLFWNELYVDPTKPPGNGSELRDWPKLGSLLSQETLVPYRAAMALKRQAMDFQMGNFIASKKGRSDLEAFLEAKPEARDYARFRAAEERLGPDWHQWPQEQRGGELTAQDFDPRAVNYHAFAQWRIDSQLSEVAASARSQRVSLYLDLPIGVHAAGYDAWRYQDLFVGGTSVGAPPDPVTTSGQDWGFPPVNPEALRRSGYSYLRAYLQHHMQVSGVLRMDHVMGLHRLYWIPEGSNPREGIYVRYPFEELYAVHSLESHRHSAVIVGEDLGIVPNQVARGLDRHAVTRLYVTEISLWGPPEEPLLPIPRRVVASIGTHDLPPFASYWQDLDIERRTQLGVLSQERATQELSDRAEKRQQVIAYLRKKSLLAPGDDSLAAVLHALMAELGESDAEWLMVNLEDLWLETESQNIPGTNEDQNPNWSRRARYAMDKVLEIAGVKTGLDVVRRARGR